MCKCSATALREHYRRADRAAGAITPVCHGRTGKKHNVAFLHVRKQVLEQVFFLALPADLGWCRVHAQLLCPVRRRRGVDMSLRGKGWLKEGLEAKFPVIVLVN